MDNQTSTVYRLSTHTDEIVIINKGDFIEVWAADGELYYGSMPPGTSDAAIRAAVTFYRRGFEAGTSYGRISLQGELRKLLGY